MSSIISKTSLEKFESARKYVLKAAIWLLVGGVILGALTILFGGMPSGEVIGKFMGTLFIIALMMIISVNNFKMIASENAAIQVFALVGLVSNIVWALLWTLLCWQPEWGADCSGLGSRYYTTICEMSTLFKCAVAFSYLSALGLIGSNVLSIQEYDKGNLIRPLKITAVSCATYEMLYLTVMVFFNYDFDSEFATRLGALAVFVGFAWFAITLTALIISSNEKVKRQRIAEKKKEEREEARGNAAMPTMKTEAELRAEIEEKVRREMIEKEVRAKVEAEQLAQASGDSKSEPQVEGAEKIVEESFEVKE